MFRAAIAAVLLLLPLHAAAQDSQEGYYFPPISSNETFTRTLIAGPAGDRAVRVAFVTEVTKAMLAAPDSPAYVIFAKGDDAQHMIIVATGDEVFRTLYRARAVLAQLTSNIRGTAFLQKLQIADQATWFDLVKMLGFKDLVISDGVNWSHQVLFE